MKSHDKCHVVSIVGARPQFVKLAALAPVLGSDIRHTIIHTGQHYDDNMSRLFFRQLGLPRIHTNLGVGGIKSAVMTGRIVSRLEPILNRIKPNLALVYGDTTSTLAGALTARQCGIPVAHVEAGMRSWVDEMPEEVNRKLTDHCSSLLFCSNAEARRNLRRENATGKAIVCGDLMYELLHDQRGNLARADKPLRRFKLKPGQYLYLTVHRANTLGSRDRLEQLVEILESIDEPVFWPVHPHTLRLLKKNRLVKRLECLDQLHLSQPLGYLENLNLVKNARVVLTDSGGLQKEAIFLGTPVLTLRGETEWNDTLKLGNRLVDLDQARIHRGLAKPPKVKRIEFRVKNQRPSRIIKESIENLLSR